MLSLSNAKWEKFNLNKIFTICKCKGCKKSDMITGQYPYVARSAENNGITGYCGNTDFLNKGNSITIHAEWKETYCAFYQKNDYVSDGMIASLSNEKLDNYNALFVCTILSKTKYDGTGLKKSLENLTIRLPAKNLDDHNFEPDWQWMSNFIKERENDIVNKYSNSVKNALSEIVPHLPKLTSIVWKTYELQKLFKISKCKGCKKSVKIPGQYPYVARSAENNGITGFCGNTDFLNKGNSITIHAEWKETYCAFYQKKDYVTDGMIAKLESNKLNQWNGIFIATILNKIPYNGEGLKLSLKSVKISLPSKLQNNKFEPDWEYMTKYIKMSSPN